MRGKNVVSSRNLFVTMSLVLLTVYVGYLFAANPNPPFPTFSSNSDTKTGSYNDNGTTVDVKAYVAYNYMWNEIDEEYSVRTYHFARVWNLPPPDEAEFFNVEFRHRPFDGVVFGAGDAPGVPFDEHHIRNGLFGDKDGSLTAWEKDATYTSTPDVDVTFEWDDIYTQIRFDGSTEAAATKPFWLPAPP